MTKIFEVPWSFYLKEPPAHDCKDIFEVEDKDLNGDAIKEYFVQAATPGLCGATGNCSTWVVGQRDGTYRILLDAGSIETIDVYQGRSEGYRNVTTLGGVGGEDHYIGIYKFKRGKYHVYKCNQARRDINGNEHFSPLKPTDCQ